MTELQKIKKFLSEEFVLVASIVCVVVSMFFVEMDAKVFASYIDWKSLGILMSLMLVSEGLKLNGVFTAAASKMTRAGNIKVLVLCLTLLPLVAAMLVTNDVALITFVPLSIAALLRIGRGDLIMGVVILQTIAANLGASITPIGDPHNLYIYMSYAPSISDWFKATWPYLPLGLIMVAIPSVILASKKPVLSEKLGTSSPKSGLKGRGTPNSILAILAVLCILGVLGIVDWRIVVVAVMAVMSATNRQAVKNIDWYLLVTFICFFVFSGNLRSIPAVSDFLGSLAQNNTFEVTVVSSQVISNVPATVVLAPFTTNWKELAIGADVGAFGTPIASLANLISMKIYFRSEGAKRGRYMLYFTIAEVVSLALLWGFAAIVTL